MVFVFPLGLGLGLGIGLGLGLGIVLYMLLVEPTNVVGALGDDDCEPDPKEPKSNESKGELSVEGGWFHSILKH